MTHDLREPRTPRRMFENINWAGIQLGLQADACNWGAAVEADAIGEQKLEADANGEQHSS